MKNFIVFSYITILLFSLSCDCLTSLEGNIYDVNDNAIKDAIITLYAAGEAATVQSDENGYFYLSSPMHGCSTCGSSDEDMATYSISKDG